jgi:hypothetical protein
MKPIKEAFAHSQMLLFLKAEIIPEKHGLNQQGRNTILGYVFFWWLVGV